MLVQDVLLGLLAAAPLQHRFTIVNDCPTVIPLFINGKNEGNLAVGAVTTRTFPQDWSGLIYTSANGGNGQTGAKTTRAGFFLKNDYYYTVVDPANFNTAVSIWPARAPRRGFCPYTDCESLSCPAFKQPPTAFPPPNPTVPPKSPLFACGGGDTAYTVTFCPNRSFPPDVGREIHPNGNSKKCLDVRGAKFENGTPVQIFDCNGTPAQRWSIKAGSTKVQLTGTNFCLDAGSNPGVGVGMKIWQCIENIPAQAWTYTADFRIALNGKGLCLDDPDGSVNNGLQVQTWTCQNNNKNQVWTV